MMAAHPRAPRPSQHQLRWQWTLPRRYRAAPSVLCVLILLILTGCPPPYELLPLTTAHPAHPEAIAAPAPPLSNTLAYGPLDMPSPRPAYAMAQAAAPSEQEGRHAVVGKGKVIAVVPSSGQLVVDHEAIKGFMDAMTMGYRVDPPSLLEGLQAGDQIRFTIGVAQNAIVHIETLNK